MPDDEPLYRHEPDHVIAVKHGGLTARENLAYSCFDCNRTKGSDIASLDPLTGALTALYSPRTHEWAEHFRFNGPVIEALTPVSRVTVALLRLHAPIRITIRASLMSEGRYPLLGTPR